MALVIMIWAYFLIYNYEEEHAGTSRARCASMRRDGDAISRRIGAPCARCQRTARAGGACIISRLFNAEMSKCEAINGRRRTFARTDGDD